MKEAILKHAENIEIDESFTYGAPSSAEVLWNEGDTFAEGSVNVAYNGSEEATGGVTIHKFTRVTAPKKKTTKKKKVVKDEEA